MLDELMSMLDEILILKDKFDEWFWRGDCTRLFLVRSTYRLETINYMRKKRNLSNYGRQRIYLQPHCSVGDLCLIKFQ